MGYSATTSSRLIGKSLGLFAACGLAIVLGGCGGIEFQGKAFDYIGLSSVGKPQDDIRMTERAPLLVPPNVKKLPPPGMPAVTRADWPADSDKERKRLAALRKAEEEQKAAKAEPDNPYAGKPKLLDKLLGKNKTKDEEEMLDVPEPDPTDKTAEDRTRERSTATPHKPVDQSLNAPATPAAEDPFHPSAPDSYTGMSKPSGNNASW